MHILFTIMHNAMPHHCGALGRWENTLQTEPSHPSRTVVRFGCLLYGRPKVENSHAPAAYHFYDSHSESPTYSTYVATTTALLNMHGRHEDDDSTVVEIRTVTMWDLICLPTTPRTWMTGRPRMRSYGQFNQQSPPSFDARANATCLCPTCYQSIARCVVIVIVVVQNAPRLTLDAQPH